MSDTVKPTANYKHLTSELHGLLDLGMREESIEKAREILRHPELEIEGFNLAAFAVVDWNLPDLLKSMESDLVSSFLRLPKEDQEKAKHYMCGLYVWLQDYPSAIPYASTKPLTAFHMRDSMVAFLEVPGHEKEADALLALADPMLAGNLSPYDRAIVLYTKARHAMGRKAWDKARDYLAMLNPLGTPWNGSIAHPHWDDSYRDRIRIRFFEVLEELEQNLKVFHCLGQERHSEAELTHAGLNEGCLSLLRRDHERMIRIVRLLARRAPGVIPPVNT